MLQKYEHMVKILDFYNKKLENTKFNKEARLGELIGFIRGLSYQHTLILQTLQQNVVESSSIRERLNLHNEDFAVKTCKSCDKG
jgi:hypothetical protein